MRVHIEGSGSFCITLKVAVGIRYVSKSRYWRLPVTQISPARSEVWNPGQGRRAHADQQVIDRPADTERYGFQPAAPDGGRSVARTAGFSKRGKPTQPASAGCKVRQISSTLMSERLLLSR